MTVDVLTEEDGLARVDALQRRYIRALDSRDMDAWANCFGPVCSYICITRENVEQNSTLALMLDDNHDRVLDRVTYVQKIWDGIFEDYATRHFVQRIECSLDGRLARVESNVVVAYTGWRGRSGMLAAGTYLDEIDLGGSRPLFRSKKVVLDTTTTPRYLVYPI